MRKRLSINDIYDPEKKIDFDGPSYPDVIWLDDDHFILRKTDPKTQHTEWRRMHAVTGESTAFYDALRLRSAIQQLLETSEEDAGRLAHLPNYVLHPQKTAFLINHRDHLYRYGIGDHRLERLTSVAAPVFGEEFSPDARFVSFIRDNNIHVVDLETRSERALTSDGSTKTLNGRLDWVYQEEIYGRGNFKGYWWSPDSRRIAYLQLDESPLKEYPVTDYIPYQPELEITNYPLAGDPNPKVRLAVVNISGGATEWVDTSKYESIEFLIVRVGWTPDSYEVVFQVQEREQRWLDLNIGRRTVIEEKSDTWVGVCGEPRWLSDGSFLWLSERSGWKHIYHCMRDGTSRAVTSGNWEVRNLIGVDERNGAIYFTGTHDSHIATHTYRVQINGTNLQRLTQRDGTHRSIFNAGFTQCVDYFSNVTTPTQLYALRSDGSDIHVLIENDSTVLTEYQLQAPQFLQVRTQDGFEMEAMMITPPDFDPTRRYPVLSFTYSGPHHPQVANAWGGEKYMFHQMLAQMGYITWICDSRTASGKGIQSAWPIYRYAGELELRDLEDGIRWLKSQSYVDPERIGLWGWSYGGYMTCYALTHSSQFKVGIAGAPVTDWRNYDSIYTERFMAAPQNNPDGYLKSAPVNAAANLNGKLLLIHGATDDNVHLQNTLQFAHALQQAGKQFQLMIYPRTRHVVTDPLALKHLRTLMMSFILENL